MNIILFGPPGAGKGTQANNLVNNFNLHKISAGDLLRNEVENKTAIGDQIKHNLDQGLLVSDEIINALILNILSNKKYFNRLIFDGYPRNLDQVKNLDSQLKRYNQEISCVLSLNVDKESIIKRISGRQTCASCGLIFNKHFKPSTKTNHSCDPKFLTTRGDDNDKTIINRFDTYLKKTLPIINFYKKQNLLHQINGMKKIDQIYEEIQAIITSLET